jgi:3',5'-cyclic AMP phosphodiesterase CpdA
LKFRLAHLSDPHLGPLPLSAAWRNFAAKRLLGTVSWQIKRKHLHLNRLADSVRADILANKPDHIAFTGDIVNVAALTEFDTAKRWIAALGSAQDVTFVPGNHDAYVAVPYAQGLQKLEAYMEGDMRVGHATVHLGGSVSFPFVRLRRNVAFIGLSSSQPQSLSRANGELGATQMATLGLILDELHAKGYARVVLIHHPPLYNQAPDRRRLHDAKALEAVLAEHGAELVLHGHNHSNSLAQLTSKTGVVPIYGAPSASMKPSKHHDAAGWTLFTLERIQGNWKIDAVRRAWNDVSGSIQAETAYPVLTN